MTSAWTTPSAASLISKDHRTGLIVAGISGGDNEAQKYAKQLADQLVHDRDGVTVRAGGEATIYWQVEAQTKKDLLLMESIAMPLSFVVLVWVFGGLVAAAVPMAVGGFAILGSMAVLHAVSLFTNVSIFALNLSVALGLALAIDYTLLILSRYRDELAAGATGDAALIRTMVTAGRTVLFSAMTVASSMVTMLLFPQYFLKSFAYAGVAVVAFAACAAIVVTPAAIVLLGGRLDSLDVRRLLRRMLGRPDPQPKPVERTFWYRWTTFVMRHAVPIGAAIIAVLLVLGAPFLGVRWGFPDDRILPTSVSARQVGDELRNDFAGDAVDQHHRGGAGRGRGRLADLSRYSAALSRVPAVTSACSPGGTFVDGSLVGPPSAPTGIKDGSAFLTVSSYRAAVLGRVGEPAATGCMPSPPRLARPCCWGVPHRAIGDSVHAITSRLAARARDHRRDHLGADVLADRKRGTAGQGRVAQHLVADGRIRCDGMGLSGGASRRAGLIGDRHAGGESAGVVVLHRLWAVDGLRGVPDLPDP